MPEQTIEPKSKPSSELYRTFNDSIKARENLQNRAMDALLGREKEIKLAYRKGRDLPVDDDMQIDASQRTTINHNGPGWLKMAAMAALLSSVGLGAWVAGKMLSEPDRPAETSTEAFVDTDTNTHHRLRIVDPD